MELLFCADPSNFRIPDMMYEQEWNVVNHMGAEAALIDFDALVYEQNPQKAVRGVPVSAQKQALFRGWMMMPSIYEHLYRALNAKGLHLINSPEEYRHGHYLPESYPLIKDHTALTVWQKGKSFSIPDLMDLLSVFEGKSIIVKDFVKSRKHEWEQACFIPSASNAQAVERVVNQFLRLQGDEFK